jgi:molybdate transport system substrate-binding protein
MRLVLALLLVAIAAVPARAATVSAAVAANFAAPMDELAAAFKAATGNDVAISTGATGGLTTQITQGAPFEVFFAADQAHIKQLVADGHAVPGTEFTYAVGKLVLFAAPGAAAASGETLAAAGFAHLAIADPATAPYGAAARQAIAALGLADALAPKLVQGTSIAQTLGFIDSGNAELGFVALSQVIGRTDGTLWLVPADLYAPIVQDAVLLKTGESDPAAAAFLEFVRGDAARAIIARYGYGTE